MNHCFVLFYFEVLYTLDCALNCYDSLFNIKKKKREEGREGGMEGGRVEGRGQVEEREGVGREGGKS